MLFELRTYDLEVGKAVHYLELFRDKGMAMITRHLPMAGYWMTESGHLNRIHHLWVYADFAERSAYRAAAAADAEWNGIFVPEAFPLIVSQKNAFLELDEGSPLLKSVVKARLTHHRRKDGDRPLFSERWFSLIARSRAGIAASDGERIGLWHVRSGHNVGAAIEIRAAATPEMLLGADPSAVGHELMRPCALSPLR